MCEAAQDDAGIFEKQKDPIPWHLGSFYESIRDSQDAAAGRMRDSFEKMFEAWPDGEAKNGIKSRFRSNRESDHYGAVLELLTFESLRRSDLQFSVEGQHAEDSTADFVVHGPDGYSTAVEAKAICRSSAEITDDRLLHRYVEEAWSRLESPEFSLEIDGFLRTTNDTPPLKAFSSFLEQRYKDHPSDTFEWAHEQCGWKISGSFYRRDDEHWKPSRAIFSISSGCYLDNSVERARYRVSSALDQHCKIKPDRLVVSLGSSSVRDSLDENCFIMSLVGPPSYSFEQMTTRFVHSGIWREKGAIRERSPGAIIYFGRLWRDLGHIVPTLWIRPDLWQNKLLPGWAFNRASWDIKTGQCIEISGKDSNASIDPL